MTRITLAVLLTLLAAVVSVAANPKPFSGLPSLRPGLLYQVLQRETPGSEFPTYEVTFFNMRAKEAQLSPLVREFLPESEGLGILAVTSEVESSEFRPTAQAGQPYAIRVQPYFSRGYTFTKKVHSERGSL